MSKNSNCCLGPLSVTTNRPSGAKLRLVAIVDEGSGIVTSRALPSAEYEVVSLPPLLIAQTLPDRSSASRSGRSAAKSRTGAIVSTSKTRMRSWSVSREVEELPIGRQPAGDQVVIVGGLAEDDHILAGASCRPGTGAALPSMRVARDAEQADRDVPPRLARA